MLVTVPMLRKAPDVVSDLPSDPLDALPGTNVEMPPTHFRTESEVRQGVRICPDYTVGLSFRVVHAGNLLSKMPERGISYSKELHANVTQDPSLRL